MKVPLLCNCFHFINFIIIMFIIMFILLLWNIINKKKFFSCSRVLSERVLHRTWNEFSQGAPAALWWWNARVTTQRHKDTETQTRPADAPYWFIEFTDRNEAQRLFRQDYFITFYFTRWISTPQPHHSPPPECHHHAASTGTSWRRSGWCWWTTRVYRACTWPGCSLPAWSADGRLYCHKCWMPTQDHNRTPQSSHPPETKTRDFKIRKQKQNRYFSEVFFFFQIANKTQRSLHYFLF